jgi:hypothetical protein
MFMMVRMQLVLQTSKRVSTQFVAFVLALKNKALVIHPPMLVTHWTCDHTQATKTYEEITDCPMNWPYCPKFDAKYRSAYELRAQWNPVVAPWPEVVKAYKTIKSRERELS